MYAISRRTGGLLAFAVGILTLTALQASPAYAATHYYQDLTSRASGKVANVGFGLGDKSEGAAVRQYHDSGNNDWNNQWEEINSESATAWRSLRNRWSGLCMDVSGTDDNARVFQATCDNTRSQKWRSRYDLTGSNYWGAWESKWADYVGKPNRVLTIYDLADATSHLVLWQWYAGYDQQWHYETEAQS